MFAFLPTISAEQHEGNRTMSRQTDSQKRLIYDSRYANLRNITPIVITLFYYPHVDMAEMVGRKPNRSSWDRYSKIMEVDNETSKFWMLSKDCKIFGL